MSANPLATLGKLGDLKRRLWFLVGALVVAKVVLVMEHVPLGPWVRKQPAALEVTLRTLLYTVGVLMALLIEKAFEARHEDGGFVPALVQVFQHRDIHHVWANTIAVSCALSGFNALACCGDTSARDSWVGSSWRPCRKR